MFTSLPIEFKGPKEQPRDIVAEVIFLDFRFLALDCLTVLDDLFVHVNVVAEGREESCGNSQRPREVSINPSVEIISKI